MVSLDPKELTIPLLHQYLLGSIGPRPIAFASTIDKDGNRNLAPFSFFNVFSANPPILIFSPARSGRTNTTKDTHNNVKEVAEVVINVVTYDMVHQMSLASSPFEAGVDEFEKAGFTPVASDTIRPFRVKESPVQMECKVLEVKELGQNGGAGNLVICEVLKIHISESVLDEKGMIDQEKIDLVSRMGGNWYCRANGESLFEVDKPLTTIGIGVDALPAKIKMCKELTGNDFGILGNLQSVPNNEEMINELLKLPINLSIPLAKQLLIANKPIAAYAVLHKIL
ncbi:MAG TPA: flavin reductase [Bacteroidetes bacterium]|jgi:flavin reductase (DIM6/NTAB) family NADH-FMN oxidoreductase RutF|nr:flavin reductase [Bacteroidota bacterium]